MKTKRNASSVTPGAPPSGPASPAQQRAALQALAAAMPFNAGKAREIGADNQGVAVADNQNSLKAGLRGPTLLEDFILREKITHFDHERIPERIVHARGSARTATSRPTSRWRGHPRRVPAGAASAPGVRALLHRGRRARLGRHRARRARLRREVLHRRGQLGPGRQQHPGVLHPGRDEVPRPRPRRQARAAPRMPQAAGARHLLGLRLADARVDAHADVGHVRPRHPAQLPHDGGLRRAHLPLVNAAGESHFVKFHWKPVLGTHSLVWDEAVKISGGADPTSTAATCGRPSRRASTPSGSSACRSSPRSRPRVRLRRARRHQAHPRGAGAGAPVGRMVLNRNPTTSSPRPSRSPSAPRTSCPASTSATTRCCRAASTPTSTPSSPAWAAPTSTRSRSTRRWRPVHNNQRDGCTARPSRAGAWPTSRTRSAAAARSHPVGGTVPDRPAG
jgi:catalase